MSSFYNWLKCKLLRVYNLITYRHFVKESVYASLFNNATGKISWLQEELFFPSKSAANYSFLYIYLRVLLTIKPSMILEFGLGQSTILSNAYVKSSENVELDVVEGNKVWIGFFCDQNIPAENTKIILSPIDVCEVSVGKINFQTLWYKNVPEKKYDLVILDGPEGSKSFARAGILNYIHSILSKHFVIIIDDYNVFPTRQTADLIKKKMRLHGVDYCEFTLDGTKQQLCITSPCFDYLSSI